MKKITLVLLICMPFLNASVPSAQQAEVQLDRELIEAFNYTFGSFNNLFINTPNLELQPFAHVIALYQDMVSTYAHRDAQLEEGAKILFDAYAKLEGAVEVFAKKINITQAILRQRAAVTNIQSAAYLFLNQEIAKIRVQGLKTINPILADCIKAHGIISKTVYILYRSDKLAVYRSLERLIAMLNTICSKLMNDITRL